MMLNINAGSILADDVEMLQKVPNGFSMVLVFMAKGL